MHPFLPRACGALSLSLALLWPAPSAAQALCSSPGASEVSFTSVSPDRPTDATAAVQLNCIAGTPGFVRYCIYIGSGSPIPGIDPRWMTDYNGSQMAYDLYSDGSRSSIIGPPPAGGGYPVYTGTLAVPGSYASTTISAPIYGRVPAGQLLPAVHVYQSQISNAHIAWAYSASGVPASCSIGTDTGTAGFHLNVKATTASGCRISLATDVDFGAAADLASARDATGNILVRCPLGVPWSIALDDGMNSVAGTRRMSAGSGSPIAYELYQDAGRTQRWGNAGTGLVTGVGAGEATPQAAPVFGRVPVQSGKAPGTYVDTVTTTLTY